MPYLKAKIHVEVRDGDTFGKWLHFTAEQLKGADAIIVMTNNGTGYDPVRFLLPHQLLEKEVMEYLVELNSYYAEVYVAPVHTADIIKVAEIDRK